MSKIDKAFCGEKALIGFIVAGDPTIEDTLSYLKAMEQAGVNLIEIGIPFSDPVAEGPVIQAANQRSLAAGTTTDKVFEIVGQFRKESSIPLVFLSYINPVFHCGYEAFFARCKKLDVDGLIVPDLPFEERCELSVPAAQYGIDLISMVAPTSQTRIPKIVKGAGGFIYAVSSMGVTGIRDQLPEGLSDMIRMIRQATPLPIAIGFGINTPEQAARMAKIGDGVIVGSAIVKLIEAHQSQATEPLKQYLRSLRSAIDSVAI